MIKDIRYNGYTSSPSDYDCLDGDLAAVGNLIHEGGSLRPIMSPKVVCKLEEGYSILHIHNNAGYEHYIINDTKGTWYWREIENETLTKIHDFGEINIYKIETIGNTLVVLTEEGMCYMLWKGGDEKKYLFLGSQMPELPISFALQGALEGDLHFTETPSTSTDVIVFQQFDKLFKDKGSASNAILGLVNKFVQEESVAKGKFIFPFFVRYAYRLYNGDLSHHSAPILMLPNTVAAPLVYGYDATSSYTRVEAVVASLVYKSLTTREDFDNWTDIISSIDIFVSAPIYTYDQSGECEGIYEREGTYGKVNWSRETNSHFIGKINSKSDYYQNWDIKRLHYLHSRKRIGWIAPLPRPDIEKIEENIKDCGLLYLISSLSLDDVFSEPLYTPMGDGYKEVPIEDGVLSSLVTREVMSDDYQTHDKLIPKTSYVYNNRLHIANIKRRIFNGFDPASMLARTDGFLTFSLPKTDDGTIDWEEDQQQSSYLTCHTRFSTDEGAYMLSSKSSVKLSSRIEDIYFLYYPDTNAKQMIVQVMGKSWSYTYPLTAHTTLNGSFFARSLSIYSKPSWSVVPILSSFGDVKISLPNKIYSSEVNNPFHFPATSINTIGNGVIFGMASSTQALSEGQFGQFPMYAFTSEGVWALELKVTGEFTSKQPTSRDICVSASSITSIDNAVLFSSERGLMLLSGSKSICITDSISKYEPFDVANLKYAHDLLSDNGNNSSALNYGSFNGFFEDSRILYDYVHQRIILYNKEYEYAYVFSIESKMWSIIESNISLGVNSYPNSLAISHNNELIDFSTEENNDVACYLITRPLKLDAGDILKTINAVIQRGVFVRGDIKSVLYGSRDMINWMPVYSSSDHVMRGMSGTAYKYYRLLLFGKLTKDKSLLGATIQYQIKDNNKIR